MTQRTSEQTEQTLHRTFETPQVTSWDICCGLFLSSCALFEDCEGPAFQSQLCIALGNASGICFSPVACEIVGHVSYK